MYLRNRRKMNVDRIWLVSVRMLVVEVKDVEGSRERRVNS